MDKETLKKEFEEVYSLSIRRGDDSSLVWNFFYRKIEEREKLLKQSLCSAIEKRKKFVEECLPPDAHYDARKKGALHEIEKVFELLDNVLPLKR